MEEKWKINTKISSEINLDEIELVLIELKLVGNLAECQEFLSNKNLLISVILEAIQYRLFLFRKRKNNRFSDKNSELHQFAMSNNIFSLYHKSHKKAIAVCFT